MLTPTMVPDLFVDLVVPELQRRGRLRREYVASTVSGIFGLHTWRGGFSA